MAFCKASSRAAVCGCILLAAKFLNLKMKPKLSIVVGVLNQHDLTRATAQMMVDNLDYPEETELIFIDNGSDTPFSDVDFWDPTFQPAIHPRYVRNEQNVGNYPLF